MRTISETPLPFGQQLKRLRAQLDLTQEALAERASCSVQTIRFFESGRRRPSLEMAEHLAELLKIPPEERAAFVRQARAALPTMPAPTAVVDAVTTPDAVATTDRHRPPTGATLIGREGELLVLRNLLLVEEVRLITLLGAGGIGKTQLALTLANALVDQLPDGAIFVPLTPLQHAYQLPGAVANTLGLTLQNGRDTQEELLAYLASRQLLLILDNFEQLLGEGDDEATRWITELLRLPGLQLLVTSRERLRLSGERVFELSGLALPPESAPPERADAVLLFLERAEQVDSNFVLNAENQEAIYRICRLVDGMPLAIELAATWVRMLSCQEIVDELQRSIDFLVLADRDMPPRHHSMRAVLDHSWALLNGAEQRLLAELSVFRGGCGRAAARTVTGATLPLLAALIDKSLVRRVEGESAEARYTLHELTRQYAAEQLASDPAHERAVQERHATYFAEVAAQSRVALAGAHQMVTLTVIEAELDNIRTAWAFALDAGLAPHLQQMVHSLGETFYWRGRYREGLALFQEAAKRLAPTPQSSPDQRYLRCEVEGWVASFATQLGHTAGVEAHFARVNQTLDDLAHTGYDVRSGKALLLSEYALFLMITIGNYAGSLALQEECVALCRQLNNDHYLAKNLVRLSQILHFLGRYAEAVALAEEALAVCRRSGDQFISIGAMERLALTLTYQGNFHEAEAHFRAALAAAEATHQPAKTASVLTNLGVVLTFSGRFAEGQRVWQRALTLSKAVDDHNYIVHDLILLGFAALHLGNFAEAMARSQEGLSSADGYGYVRDGALAQLLLASAQLAQGELAQAALSIENALIRYQTIDHPDELSWAMAVQLYILRAQGEQEKLPALAMATLAILRSAEGFNAVQTLLPILALLLFDQGELAQAVELAIALRQSTFVGESAWFTQVAAIALQTQLDRLPPAMQQFVAAEVANGERRNGLELLRTLTL